MIFAPLLIIFFLYLFIFGIFKGSRYKIEAIALISISLIINLISNMFYVKSIDPIGQIADVLGFSIGFFGLQHKIQSRIPLIIFVSSFIFLQIIGYGLNINLFKNSFFGFAVPIILLVVSVYWCQKKASQQA